MLFVYECTGNIIADFKKFYDTQLSEQDKKKIFIPTYDCMKRYQGSWHVEQKPLFTNCFFIECRDKEELKTTLSRQHCSDSLAEAVMSGITPLRPEQEEFLKALIQPDTKTISMSTGYIKDGTTHVTQGPFREERNLSAELTDINALRGWYSRREMDSRNCAQVWKLFQKGDAQI